MKKNCIVFCALLTLFLLTGHAAAESDRIDDFFFDGCSSIAPEGTLEDPALWCECCLEHDVKYWKGGTWTDRRNADLDLMDCVAEKSGSNALGLMYYLGVRMGGSPFFLTPYRWGYGWEFGRGTNPSPTRKKPMPISCMMSTSWPIPSHAHHLTDTELLS